MRIIFTVTNDLSYDQRMQRICRSLAQAGHEVVLVGRSLPHSIQLIDRDFRQVRLHCPFQKGFWFYAFYNIQLFAYLLMAPRWDVVCSVDLDTMAAGYLASTLLRRKRVFDAHEYFEEVPELSNRPLVKSFWRLIGKILVPRYRYAYTVGPALAKIFTKMYGVSFEVIRNMPLRQAFSLSSEKKEKIILYQGALNEGRGIEAMILSMQYLEAVQLWLVGEGDLSAALRQLTKTMGLEHKVRFIGYVTPEKLQEYTRQAWLGINLLERRGASYYYSLANKFFDYVQAGVPVVTMDFPEYQALNQEYQVALLLPDLATEGIISAVKRLQSDPALYDSMCSQANMAAAVWHWEAEMKRLLAFWQAVDQAPDSN